MLNSIPAEHEENNKIEPLLLDNVVDTCGANKLFNFSAPGVKLNAYSISYVHHFIFSRCTTIISTHSWGILSGVSKFSNAPNFSVDYPEVVHNGDVIEGGLPDLYIRVII